MSIDVLPSCSAPSSLLFDQFSAADSGIASSDASTSSSSSSSSQSSSPSSSPSSGVHHHHQSPPSPPPGRAHRNNNKAKYGADAAANSADFRFIQNAVAMAILARLHRCCCQLFWLTIVCLIGAVKDANNNSNQREGGGNGGGEQQAANTMEQQQQKARTTFQEVRKSVVQQQAGQRRACKTLHELEMQLLRHLTCPQTAVLRPLRSAQHHKKRHFLSRPPSPQLFDISEEMNE